ERAAHKAQFLRDVRARVRELNGRGYIDPETTVDCMLLFIPNEQLYAFIQEQDATILDAALRDKVVLCSPLTLFAVLAVIRQSVDSFAIERRASELLSLLSSFRRQWGKFVDEMDRVGRHLDIAGRSFDDLQGVRRRQLERPLDQLDRLRADALGPAAPAGAGMARLADVDVDENQIALA
ncbi:MAG TPA: DNA recombination protein RmuC, partial [Egibacteraceae bacterium]|nr:DNA recombination protein RmuC [Egibacteraceae bacterium]